jgi:type VI protein secretion system component Hcp
LTIKRPAGACGKFPNYSGYKLTENINKWYVDLSFRLFDVNPNFFGSALTHPKKNKGRSIMKTRLASAVVFSIIFLPHTIWGAISPDSQAAAHDISFRVEINGASTGITFQALSFNISTDVVQYRTGNATQRDTSLPGGLSFHPLKITKKVNAFTAEIRRKFKELAQGQNAKFTLAVIVLDHAGGELGRITFGNTWVSEINTIFPMQSDPAYQGYGFLEQISFIYENVQWAGPFFGESISIP